MLLSTFLFFVFILIIVPQIDTILSFSKLYVSYSFTTCDEMAGEVCGEPKLKQLIINELFF